ncbi:MAG: helix-turn-helix domain-containing protein [Lachnospiraceae bacterium]|nr:helix-turn-helix domain-containing protein [Lachnospiraceae bacterium]MCI7180637.1 helix-turn-helix domain-containing protein [Lachnospiraceae bacterium]
MKTYTVKEIADMLNTNPETVRRWIRNGKLHAEKNSNKSGNVILETSLNTFASTMPKYQKMISSNVSNALIGTSAAVASSLISGIIAEMNRNENLEYDDRTVIQLLNDEILKSSERIDNKEKSIHQLELEIDEEKNKIKYLTGLLSEVKRKD